MHISFVHPSSCMTASMTFPDHSLAFNNKCKIINKLVCIVGYSRQYVACRCSNDHVHPHCAQEICSPALDSTWACVHACEHAEDVSAECEGEVCGCGRWH